MSTSSQQACNSLGFFIPLGFLFHLDFVFLFFNSVGLNQFWDQVCSFFTIFLLVIFVNCRSLSYEYVQIAPAVVCWSKLTRFAVANQSEDANNSAIYCKGPLCICKRKRGFLRTWTDHPSSSEGCKNRCCSRPDLRRTRTFLLPAYDPKALIRWSNQYIHTDLTFTRPIVFFFEKSFMVISGANNIRSLCKRRRRRTAPEETAGRWLSCFLETCGWLLSRADQSTPAARNFECTTLITQSIPPPAQKRWLQSLWSSSANIVVT